MENYGNFGWALSDLREGKSVYRKGWNGPGQYLTLQVPDENSKMTLPYVYNYYNTGGSCPLGAKSNRSTSRRLVCFIIEKSLNG